jgi:CheY-like chemotaxis protein
VDDDHDTTDSLALMLALWGHRPLVAYDGPAALALYAAHRPGVVLLDLLLGGPGGCEVARSIRRDYPGDRTLIVAVSGLGRGEDRRRSAEAGVDVHLVKPVDPDELGRLLEEAAVGAGGPGPDSIGRPSLTSSG